MNKIKKLLPLAIFIIGFIFLINSPLGDYLSFDALQENRQALLEFRDANYLLAVLMFMGLYIICVAFSLPFASFLTITAGFLFAKFTGTFLVVTSATLGALCIFFAAKTVLGDSLRSKAGPWLTKLEAGFKENATSYMLVLRLVPLFPFFVVNIVPALLNVRASTFTITTFLGIIPGSFVFCTVGAGLGSIFDSGEKFTPAGILTPDIILALVGLAVLSMVPVLYKKIKGKQSANS